MERQWTNLTTIRYYERQGIVEEGYRVITYILTLSSAGVQLFGKLARRNKLFSAFDILFEIWLSDEGPRANEWTNERLNKKVIHALKKNKEGREKKPMRLN